jgi:putative nucleotidyltransferase with HDIG domain
MIPSPKECCRFMNKYGMLENIKAHSIVVENVAALIARELQNGPVPLSLEMVSAGALMHDIGKTLCLNSSGDHAAMGREICLRNNLPEIADIVGEHVRLKDYGPSSPIGEKEIVYYADKRVNHDAIVSLDERLAYLLERYGRNEEYICKRIRGNFDQCRALEKRLFTKLSFRPGELTDLVSQTGPCTQST